MDSTQGRCCFFSHVDFQSGFVASGSCRAGVVRAMEAPLIPHLLPPAVRMSHVISRSSVGWLSRVCVLLCFLFFSFQLQSHHASSRLHFSPLYSAEQSITLSRCCLVLPLLLSLSALVISLRARKEYGRLRLLLLFVASTLQIASSFYYFYNFFCQSCTFVSRHSRRLLCSAQLLTVYETFCLQAVYS